MFPHWHDYQLTLLDPRQTAQLLFLPSFESPSETCYYSPNYWFTGIRSMVIYTNKKRDKTPKAKFVSPEEFWTKERKERARRSQGPVPNEEEFLRFMHEAMGHKHKLRREP